MFGDGAEKFDLSFTRPPKALLIGSSRGQSGKLQRVLLEAFCLQQLIHFLPFLWEPASPPASHMAFEQNHVSVTKGGKHSLGKLGARTMFTRHHQLGVLVGGKVGQTKQDLPGRGMDCTGDVSAAVFETAPDVDDDEGLSSFDAFGEFLRVHLSPFVHRRWWFGMLGGHGEIAKRLSAFPLLWRHWMIFSISSVSSGQRSREMALAENA